MLFQLKSYIQFLSKSTNEHGVHSPFVFNLVTKCFYDKRRYPEYNVLQDYRANLLSSNETIRVTDFGAGSKVFKSHERKVSQIASTAGITKRRAELLFRVVSYLKPENILEIGTSLGLATAALSLGRQDSNITTLEGCRQTAAIAKAQFAKHKFVNIALEVLEFNSYLDNLPPTTFDLIYFDGNHTKEATLSYFNSLLKTATNDSVWIFDDIHWSEEMHEAWEVIKQNPAVIVTIDTFQWGFVFFRKEQKKENFIVRI